MHGGINMESNLTAKFRILPVLAVLGLWQGSAIVRADIPTGDQIVAQWSDVITAGNVANDPATGNLTYMDNTGTAVYSIGNDVGTNNELSWGTPGSSELIFFGTGVSVPTDQTTPFALGSLFFFNGESALNSLIFGATLTFYEQSLSDPSDMTSLAAYNVTITTTNNQYAGVTDPTTDQLNTDADYINICGALSGICDASLEAYEFGEGSSAGYINLELYGTVAGDPQLSLTGASIVGGTGTIGNELPLAATPEPSGLALLSIALVGGIGVAKRRKLRRTV
jgi:hypothetical protein